MNLKLTDYLFLIGIVLILLVGVFLVLYYFNYTTEECIKDPFIFGAKQMEDVTTGKFQGIGYIKNDMGLTVVMIHFNSTDAEQEAIIK